MNHKKCPRCGESNPPQAVMCWACYTPFASVAPPTASGHLGSGMSQLEADTPKGGSNIPAWAYAAGGAVLILFLFMSAKVLLPGTNNVEEPPAPGTTTVGLRPITGNPNPPAPAPPEPGTEPILLPYTFVITPNNQLPVGVMAIVPKQQIKPSQAVRVARWASNLYMKGSHWNEMQVYVFTNLEAGTKFKDLQSGRKDAPLGQGEFEQLSQANVWPDTQAICVFSPNGKVKAVYPQSDLNFWEHLTA